MKVSRHCSGKQVWLTPKEETVLRAIARGKTTKEIAYGENLGFHTVNSHRKNIFRKLRDRCGTVCAWKFLYESAGSHVSNPA